MKNKKSLVYVLIALFLSFAVITIVMMALLYSSIGFEKGKEISMQKYLEMPLENNYKSDEGYIPDYKTAARVGGGIIDSMLDKSVFDFGHTTVRYDAENRLWKVTRGYLFDQGGFVIIEQDTGRVVKALLNK